MKIIRLTASNVKRLKAVEIAPQGHVVTITGRNGSGKSSTLDAIQYALAGKDAICREPLRRGEKKGMVECDLGEYVVRRTFTEGGGGTLTVRAPDGAIYPSPQALLDRLNGRLTFDPLAFARMDPKQQAETLRGLLGLDFAAQEAERARIYAERTAVNAAGKALRARYDAMPHHPDAPEAEVSASEILAEQEQAQRRNEKVRDLRARADAKRDRASACERARLSAAASVDEAKAEIVRWQKVLAERERELAAATTEAENAKAEAVATMQDASEPEQDLAPFRARIAEVEATNRKVRENRARAELGRELDQRRAESQRLTDAIEAIDRAKAEAIAAARMPVEGLGFDATGLVTLHGLPFDQASQAEQIKVSVAMGLALNPTLKVLLVRDASLLDADSLALVAQMAQEADAQVWLEEVESDDPCAIEIVDGAVKGADQPAGEAVVS